MLLVIAGATGTGKSGASLDIADALSERGVSATIVNADALQLYRGMDIGTAKLPPDQRRGYPHRMLDILDVSEDASVADYQQHARLHITAALDQGAVPILVGGTGLYIDSVIHRLEFPGTDPDTRLHWEAELARRGPGALASELRTVDPESASKIDPSDGRRLVRALEVWQYTGRPFSDFTRWANEPWCDYRLIVLDEPQEALAPRLAARAEEMWEAGLLAETRALVDAGLRSTGTAGKAIGYAQALAHLAGHLDEAEAREQTATATAQYARRQRTWFRRYADATWLRASELDPRREAEQASRHAN